MKRTLQNTLLLTIVVAGITGCAASKPTPKQEAVQHWNSTRSALLTTMARDQFQSGNVERARQSVDEALKLDPKNAVALVLSGRLDIERGQLELAEQSLLAAQKLEPKNYETDYCLGVVYQRWQQSSRALDMYRSAIEKAPTEAAPVLAAMEMLVASSGTEAGLSLLDSKIDRFPHNPAMHDARGQLQQQLGRNDEAVISFRKANGLDSQDSNIREHLAIALTDTGKWQEAADLIDRLVRDEPQSSRADLWIALGQCRLSLNDAVAARNAFDKAVLIDPKSTPALIGSARASLANGELSRTERSLKRAIAIDDKNAAAQLLLGYVRVEQHRYAEATEYFTRASQLDPKDPTAVCMIGYSQQQLGNKPAAKQSYERALTISPQDDLARKLLANVEQD